jgi:alkylhydroperoxidase family enzyme
MALIQTVDPEKAEGQVKEAFDTLQEAIGMVPAPMQLASASPVLLNQLWQSLQYYSQHPTLGFGLLSTIRYLVSQQINFAFCTSLNRNFLMQQGMTEEDIKELEKDPSQAPLEDNERAMLAFVIKAINTPDAVTQEDVDQLHEMGWADRDILDALAHGANMIGSSILMKTFKMDMTC